MDPEQQGKKLYSYPILKLHEIVASLRSLNIAFAEDDLRSCQPDALRKILEEFIRNTMGIGRDEMSQPALIGLSELTVQLHSGSVGEITYFRTISRLLATAGLRDFRWDDVYKPTLKRYRRILSALINFTRFRYERWARVGQNEDKLVRIRAERQAAEEENATLRRQLADLQSEQSAEAEALQHAMDESSALEVEIYTLNKRQAVVRHENTGLKAQCGHLRDDYASLRIDISEAKTTVNKLETKIVNSPARFKADIGDISVKVDAAKEELALLEARSTELDSIYEAFARADQETNAAVDLMHETEVESQSCRNEKRNIKAQHHEIENTFHKTKQAVAHHAVR
ncbi:hypothetical protein, variant [Saprolegnia diclina VS20]|uniref:Uncharacterized protein n=1 Tax=Saprolegnia diclina (strain VS20) TaxID=1156394 RepID=T0QYW5_SAPDV|nr:hypothetical protein, variant [Saprolegnia diclina VS20]EQC39275.1 hypothetical protein, variant [Saprolegnia diclina VS20]|eukprot:XP_008607336.1 hypothetical protein, variant [Saprolegnia diclina VS20]